MKRKGHHAFGIDWQGNRLARSLALGLIAASLINMLAIALGHTRPADSWWLMGLIVAVSAALGCGSRLARRAAGDRDG